MEVSIKPQGKNTKKEVKKKMEKGKEIKKAQEKVKKKKENEIDIWQQEDAEDEKDTAAWQHRMGLHKTYDFI